MMTSALGVLVMGALLATAPPPPNNTEHTSAFNQQWLDTVVSIEQQKGSVREPLGTGFLVWLDRHIVLVTARHVIKNDNDTGPLLGLALVRSDVEGELIPQSSWLVSQSNLDVACILVGWSQSSPEPRSIPLDMFLSRSIVEVGAPVLVLGYPAGVRRAGPLLKEPIVRSGIVSRVSTNGITVDSQVFPGNSGSPAVYVPVIKLGPALTSSLVGSERLVGMIITANHAPDRPGSSPVYFGLAGMVSADAIKEFIEQKVRPLLQPPAR